MKYYIICPDGSSLFQLPYELDFVIHCLWVLLNRNIDTSEYRLLDSSFNGIMCPSFFPYSRLCDGGT